MRQYLLALGLVAVGLTGCPDAQEECRECDATLDHFRSEYQKVDRGVRHKQGSARVYGHTTSSDREIERGRKKREALGKDVEALEQRCSELRRKANDDRADRLLR